MKKAENVTRTEYLDRKQMVTKRIDVVESRLIELAATLRALRADVVA
jgi:recombinational DNA repair ATPase RecF